MKTKLCPKCGKEKLVSKFYSSKTFKNGLQYSCKICSSKRCKTYNKVNKTKNATQKKEYQRKNMGVFVDANRRRRTKMADLPSTLTKEEWLKTLNIFKNSCAYCGCTWTDKDHFIPLSKGGGFTKENIVPACKKCNTTKQDRLPELFCAPKKYKEIVDKINNLCYTTI